MHTYMIYIPLLSSNFFKYIPYIHIPCDSIKLKALLSRTHCWKPDLRSLTLKNIQHFKFSQGSNGIYFTSVNFFVNVRHFICLTQTSNLVKVLGMPILFWDGGTNTGRFTIDIIFWGFNEDIDIPSLVHTCFTKQPSTGISVDTLASWVLLWYFDNVITFRPKIFSSISSRLLRCAQPKQLYSLPK